MNESSFLRFVARLGGAFLRRSLRAMICPSVSTANLRSGYSMPAGRLPSVIKICPALGSAVHGKASSASTCCACSSSLRISPRRLPPQSTRLPKPEDA